MNAELGHIHVNKVLNVKIQLEAIYVPNHAVEVISLMLLLFNAKVFYLYKTLIDLFIFQLLI